MRRIVLSILLIMLMIPMFVFADETCTNPGSIVDTSTSNVRNITCDRSDAKKSTTTHYIGEERIVLANDACTITCSENLLFSVKPMQKVLAGTGFSYPLFLSAERVCRAEYHVESFDATFRAELAAGHPVKNLQKQRFECDYYAAEVSNETNKDYIVKYELNENFKVTAELETKSSGTSETETINYVTNTLPVKGADNAGKEYKSIISYDTMVYTTCNYEAGNCNEESETLTTTSGWNATSRIYGSYTMPKKYLEKYTGKVLDTPSTESCDGVDMFFTSFTTETRPTRDGRIGTDIDYGYGISLVAENLSNITGYKSTDLNGNLVKPSAIMTAANSDWKLNVGCNYQVQNLIMPQEGDENNAKYGSLAYQYRVIDLNDPFPNRDPYANWCTVKNGATDTCTYDIRLMPKYSELSSIQRWVINLDTSSINRIKSYNSSHSYETFNYNAKGENAFIGEINTSSSKVIEKK